MEKIRVLAGRILLGLIRLALLLISGVCALGSGLLGWARRQGPPLLAKFLARCQEIGESQAWQALTQWCGKTSERISAAFAITEPSSKDFLPNMVRLQEAPPPALGRTVMRVLLIFLAALLLWSACSKVDVVAVANGKLVPQSYLKVVQPSESGIVKEILVHEGERVTAGQVLMRMDSVGSDADLASVALDIQRRELTIRMIDADLNNTPFTPLPSDNPELFQEVQARLQANRSALEASLAEERANMEKARGELYAARAVQTKLSETLPQFKAMEEAHARLAQEGYVPALTASQKRMERVEKEQELRTQGHMIEANRANVQQSERKMDQILSAYRKTLHETRNEMQAQLDKLRQELSKQEHRQDLLELKAPQNGTVKDLATHTIGSVTQPGVVLLTLVPEGEILTAEVWVSNQDRGFVHAGQKVQLKFAAFPFQKYGMVDGTVEYVSPDASDQSSSTTANTANQANSREPLAFRATVALGSTHLSFDGERLPLASGMQVSAEILINKRSVIEYFLSPVQKVVHESGRER